MKQKHTYLLYILFLLPAALWGQTAGMVLSGAGLSVVNSGNVYWVLANTDFRNNASASAFVPGTGTVLFSGNSPATVGGSASTSFYRLSVDKAGTELRIGTDIGVKDTLRLTNGNMNLQMAAVDLGTTGYVSGETYPAGNRIYGSPGETGYLKAVRNLGTGANTNIAGIGLDITVTGNALGSTALSRGHNPQASTAMGAGTSIGRYYDITPAATSGFDVELLFRYHDLDVASMPESDFVFYRSPSYGSNTSDWEEWGLDNGPTSPGYPVAGLATHNATANTVSLSGINQFSRWTVSNTNVQPLPVTLVSFSAACADGDVGLRWATASEINNDYFTIDRSVDLQLWEELGRVYGAGNSNALLQYTLTDERPAAHTTYYRLTQTDYDGTSESFKPVSVYCQGEAENRLAVFPNPADQYFTVGITVTEEQPKARLEICDLSGKIIGTRTAPLAAGYNEFMFDRAGIPPGTYYIRLLSGLSALRPLKLIIQ